MFAPCSNGMLKAFINRHSATSSKPKLASYELGLRVQPFHKHQRAIILDLAAGAAELLQLRNDVGYGIRAGHCCFGELDAKFLARGVGAFRNAVCEHEEP